MLRPEIQRLLGDLRRTREQGSFARNVMHTFRGNALITASQLLLTPVVARIYGPEAYGIYGLFMAISANLATVADLGYTPAYMLPRERDRFHDLVRLSFTLLACLLVLLLPVLLARDAVFGLFPAWRQLEDWFFLIPLGVIASTVPAILVQWLFREKAFATATTIGGATNMGLRLFNIGFGWASKGALHGLIIGELVVRGVQTVVLRMALLRHGWRDLFRGWDRGRIRSIATEYRHYPLLIFPERWVSLAGMQAPVFLLAADPQAVGHFAFATGLMLLPLRQIGYSLSTVFQQKAAEVERERPGDLPGITLGLYRRLLLIGTPLFAAATFFGDVVFDLVLGADWRLSGAYAAVLGPFFLLRLLTEPIASLAYVKREERLPLIFQGVLLVARVAAILWARPQGAGATITAYALVSTAGYVVLTALLLRAAGVAPRRVIARSLLWMGACAAAMALTRYALVGDWWPTL